eukprot:CAMPEP_0170751134 /NCGR_PEP_ID=MMETSP0437-20130122/11292_1 /TAXON_ID=0 /ORGANISM="Sexangularia sp." /LENGTH=1011 /DNA_ID=CAMNT_0011090155 /DNA_START=52 /DNA_END=3084 /DNA_ORIENTATION=+
MSQVPTTIRAPALSRLSEARAATARALASVGSTPPLAIHTIQHTTVGTMTVTQTLLVPSGGVIDRVDGSNGAGAGLLPLTPTDTTTISTSTGTTLTPLPNLMTRYCTDSLGTISSVVVARGRIRVWRRSGEGVLLDATDGGIVRAWPSLASPNLLGVAPLPPRLADAGTSAGRGAPPHLRVYRDTSSAHGARLCLARGPNDEDDVATFAWSAKLPLDAPHVSSHSDGESGVVLVIGGVAVLVELELEVASDDAPSSREQTRRSTAGAAAASRILVTSVRTTNPNHTYITAAALGQDALALGDRAGHLHVVYCRSPERSSTPLDGCPTTELHWHSNPVRAVAWAGNSHVLTGGAEATLVMWQPATRSRAFFSGARAALESIVVTDDGTGAFVRDAGGAILHFDLSSRRSRTVREAVRFRGTRPPRAGITMIPGYRGLALIPADPHSLQLVNTTTGTALSTITVCPPITRNATASLAVSKKRPSISHVAVTRDGAHLVTAEASASWVHLGHAATRGTSCTLRFYERSNNTVFGSSLPSFTLVAVAACPHGASAVISALAASPVSNLVATADEAGGLRLWTRLESTKASATPVTTPAAATLGNSRGASSQSWGCRAAATVTSESGISDACFSPDGSILALVSSAAVHLWRPISCQWIATLPRPSSAMPKRLRHVAWGPVATMPEGDGDDNATTKNKASDATEGAESSPILPLYTASKEEIHIFDVLSLRHLATLSTRASQPALVPKTKIVRLLAHPSLPLLFALVHVIGTGDSSNRYCLVKCNVITATAALFPIPAECATDAVWGGERDGGKIVVVGRTGVVVEVPVDQEEREQDKLAKAAAWEVLPATHALASVIPVPAMLSLAARERAKQAKGGAAGVSADHLVSLDRDRADTASVLSVPSHVAPSASSLFDEMFGDTGDDDANTMDTSGGITATQLEAERERDADREADRDAGVLAAVPPLAATDGDVAIFEERVGRLASMLKDKEGTSATAAATTTKESSGKSKNKRRKT